MSETIISYSYAFSVATSMGLGSLFAKKILGWGEQSPIQQFLAAFIALASGVFFGHVKG